MQREDLRYDAGVCSGMKMYKQIGIATLAIAIVVTIAPGQAVGGGPVGSGSALNCRHHSVVDYAHPLERMRPIPRVPASGKLGFGPGALRLQRPEIVSVGPVKIGYLLVNQGSRNSPGGSGWSASTQLWRVDRTGTPIRSVGSEKQSISGVWRQKSTNKLLGRYRVPRSPRAYRVDVVFRDDAGAVRGHYSEYVRVVPRRLDVRLALSSTALGIGDLLRWRLENYGTVAMSYGLQFRIEHYDGSSWVDAGLAPKGFPAVGFVAGGGVASKCQALKVPMGTEPGRYRVSKSAEIGFQPSREYLAEFDVVG